jgi:hypothetical protein
MLIKKKKKKKNSSSVSVMPIEQVTEILQKVIELVIRQSRHRNHDLLKLCFISRSFWHHARYHLYRKMAISDHIRAYVPPDFPKLGLKQAMKLFITLSKINPSLAGYVDVLYLDAHIGE